MNHTLTRLSLALVLVLATLAAPAALLAQEAPPVLDRTPTTFDGDDYDATTQHRPTADPDGLTASGAEGLDDGATVQHRPTADPNGVGAQQPSSPSGFVLDWLRSLRSLSPL